MKHVIILAHPEATSFTASLAEAYAEAVARFGDEVVIRDLYRLGFNPCLSGEERSAPKTSPAEDVALERKLIGDADVFVLVYPIWFGTPPAMLKGYIERVFNRGFAFTSLSAGPSGPLLKGKALISLTASGSTKKALYDKGVWYALKTIFDDYIGATCGLTVIDHLHFSPITPKLTKAEAERHLAFVKDKVEEHFGLQSARRILERGGGYRQWAKNRRGAKA